MVQAKIEIFTAMLAEQPENAMIWYGLAAEQYKLKNWAEAAKSLRQVVSLNPDYVAAYQLLGTAVANAGDLAGAQQAWRDGIEAADRTGAWKAKQHMRALLEGVAGADEALCPGGEKTLSGFGGAGVVEVIKDFRGDTFRAVYTVRYAGALYVLHAFQKKSKTGRETPRADIELVKQRLREAEQIAKGRKL